MAMDLWFGRTPRQKRVIKYLRDPVRSVSRSNIAHISILQVFTCTQLYVYEFLQLIKEKLSRKVEPEKVNNFEENRQTVIDLALKVINICRFLYQTPFQFDFSMESNKKKLKLFICLSYVSTNTSISNKKKILFLVL